MEDFSTQIKNALKEAGLDEDFVDQISVEKEEEIKPAVEAFKKDFDSHKDMSIEEFLKTAKKAGLEEPLKKYMQSEGDRRITEALKTRDANLAKEKEAADIAADKEKQSATLSDDQKQIVELKEQITKNNELMQGLLKKNSEEDISSAISIALKEAKLDEGFANNIHVKSVDEVGKAVTNLKEKVVAERQLSVDEKLKEMGVPSSSKGKTPTEIEAAISDYASKKGTPEDEGGIITEQLKTSKGEK